MTLTASTSVSCLHTPLTRALPWPNGTHNRHGGSLYDTAAYRDHGETRKSRHFSNFGGNNHKRQPSVRVGIEYLHWRDVFVAGDLPDVGAATAPSSMTETRRPLSAASAVERARAFLQRVDPAVAGQQGDLRTFRVCCRIVRGFDLSDDEAVGALREWNARCEPPWSERELRQKVTNARRYGREPQGGLL